MKNRTEKYFLFTVDGDWIPGSEPGYEQLLELAEDYEIPVTLFATAGFARDAPDLVSQTMESGGDVGVHGFEHGLDCNENYRTYTYDQQYKYLAKATEEIANIIGSHPRLFRAPDLQVSRTLFEVLEDLDYKIDSSIPARRYDGVWGSVRNIKYFTAPLSPYYPDLDNLRCPGESGILEIPPSAYVLPIVMTAIRRVGLRPTLLAARVVAYTTSIINFYCHPWEFVDPERRTVPSDARKTYTVNCTSGHIDGLRTFVERILSWGYTPIRMSYLL